ncbi:hypothetical protein CCP4SC76_1450020 [Gammaproteobacteria bacterium]
MTKGREDSWGDSNPKQNIGQAGKLEAGSWKLERNSREQPEQLFSIGGSVFGIGLH